MREHKFKESQKVIKSSNEGFLNERFLVNKDEPFTIFNTKWNWYSGNGILPSPKTLPKVFYYFIRPTLFRGTVLIKNLLGIHALLPMLANDYSEFNGHDVIALIKDGAAPDYEIPSDENTFREEVIAFLREHVIIYNSMSVISPVQNDKVIEKRMSIVL